MSRSAAIMPGRNKRIVICACGRDGKSSTINNILSALEGNYSITASVGYAGYHVTQKYIEYKMLIGDLGDAPDTSYVLCDTPGLDKSNADLKTKIIKAIIKGKFRCGDKVTAEGLANMRAIQPKAACVIFVIAASKVLLTEDKKSGAIDQTAEIGYLMDILQFARKHDIKTACLITKCDELDDAVKKDMRNIYYSQSIETARLVIQQNFSGFPEDRIFPIVNYTNILRTNADMMVQTLFALKHIMNDIHSKLKRTVDYERTDA